MEGRTLRKWARHLSRILEAGDDELEEYVHERLEDSPLTLADVARVREVLQTIAAMCESADPSALSRLAAALQVLRGAAEPDAPAAPHASPPADPRALADPVPAPPVPLPAAPPPAAAPPASPASAPSHPAPPAPAFVAPVAPPAPPPIRPAPPAPPSAAPTPLEPIAELASTAAMNQTFEATLPFRKAEPGGAPAPIASRLEPIASMGTTAAIKGKRGPALPFETAQPSVPELTIEQYASLCAEQAAHPERTAEIAARWGLADPRARAALDGRWAQAFAADPPLEGHFRELVTRYTHWLKAR